MSDIDVRKVLLEELNNIAPEVNVASVDPTADLREAIDIDSMDFLNFIIAGHHRLGIEYSRDRLSETCHAERRNRIYRRETRLE
jgi:acyl carrier protein